LGLAQAACVPARPLKAKEILWACALSFPKFMAASAKPYSLYAIL